MDEASSPNNGAGSVTNSTAQGNIITGSNNTIIQSGGDYVAGDKNYHITYQMVSPAPIDPPTLAAAREQLARLPLDGIPPVAVLPPGSRIPFPDNPHFVGREAELRELARLLKGQQTAAIGQIAAATGLGGIGKSQLAAAFAHRYGQYFAGGVFWLSFADPAAIPAEIASCDLPGSEELPLETRIRRVLGHWQSELPRLLIFDNCEDEALLTAWRPPTGACRVLVTSRRAQWSAALGVQALPLATLNRAESIALLRKHRPDVAGEEVLSQISAELGDLPLALHLAGSYLETYWDDPLLGRPADFLAELRAARLAHPALQGEDVTPSPTDHYLHVSRTFTLSYNRLDPADETDRVALRLLARAACLAPGEPIPRALLVGTLALAEGDREAARTASRALNRLVNLGLLGAGGETLTLHRLLADFVQQAAPDEGARAAVETALLAEADRLNEAGYPTPLLAWQPHLRAVTGVAREREDERAAGLCNTLGYHLQMIGDYGAARPYLERALAILEKALGPEHPDTAASLNNLGFLLQAMGDHGAARPYYERALAIREKALGPEHPDTARSLNNLGGLLDSMGDYGAAQPYYERAVAIKEKALGPEHPDTAASLNNLGLLLDRMGDYGAARPYLERALAIKEKTLGSEHPAIATSLNNLGFLLKAQGDYGGARPYYERALAIREKTLGPEHPDTAASLNNLGTLCYYEGDYAASAVYMRRALTIRETRLGPNHPDTQSSRRNLQAILAQLGEPNYTPDELQEALRPIVSLINKSEKAQLKLAPGTWQHTMLRDNLEALHIASALMNKKTGDINSFAGDDLQEALRAIASMISRTAKAQTKFTPGTSPHTLQKNRLKALQIAEALIKAALDKS